VYGLIGTDGVSLTATANITLQTSGSVIGSAVITVGGTGTIISADVFSGDGVIFIVGTGNLSVLDNLVGSSAILVVGTANITTVGGYTLVSGSGVISVTGSGSLVELISGTGTITITGNGGVSQSYGLYLDLYIYKNLTPVGTINKNLTFNLGVA
jgi:hypothetical protein